MIKISGKMDKSNTYKCSVVVIFNSFLFQTTKQHQGFYQISPYLLDVIQHEKNIKIKNG